MNRWLWRRLEMSPDWIFYEWELRMYCWDFNAMLSQGLLVRDLKAEKAEICFTRYGQRLHLVRTDNAVFGADTENPDEPVAELDPDELIQYRFNIDRWLSLIRTANGLYGAFCRLDRRLFFLGEKKESGETLGFVIGFFTRAGQALNLLLSLPSRLPADFDGIVVATLLFDGLPLQEIANLERLGIFWAPRLDSETLHIRHQTCRTGRKVPPGSFSAGEIEGESQFYGFKCRVPVCITGDITKSGNNVVLVGSTAVEIGDTPFLLFLRLIVELRRKKMGTVSKVQLKSEGYLSEDVEFQQIRRLRECFVRALGDLEPKDFIEGYRPKTLRVSVHPALVSWDEQKLLAHDNSRVREFVEQLLQWAKANSSLAS